MSPVDKLEEDASKDPEGGCERLVISVKFLWRFVLELGFADVHWDVGVLSIKQAFRQYDLASLCLCVDDEESRVEVVNRWQQDPKLQHVP